MKVTTHELQRRWSRLRKHHETLGELTLKFIAHPGVTDDQIMGVAKLYARNHQVIESMRKDLVRLAKSQNQSSYGLNTTTFSY